jgi:hypothetical protein
VFTARYALSPYIKQIRFVFKRLIGELIKSKYEAGVVPSNAVYATPPLIDQFRFPFQPTRSNGNNNVSGKGLLHLDTGQTDLEGSTTVNRRLNV